MIGLLDGEALTDGGPPHRSIADAHSRTLPELGSVPPAFDPTIVWCTRASRFMSGYNLEWSSLTESEHSTDLLGPWGPYDVEMHHSVPYVTIWTLVICSGQPDPRCFINSAFGYSSFNVYSADSSLSVSHFL